VSTNNDNQADAALGLTKEETKEHLQIASKQGGETHAEAGDEDEMTVPRRHHRCGETEP
jgi:hypothetical protein